MTETLDGRLQATVAHLTTIAPPELFGVFAAEQQRLAFVAISPQGPDGSLTIAEANSLTFPVLTDTGSAYAQSLGLAFDLDADVKEAQLAFGNDFTAINAGGEWSLPKPTVIVIDADNVVRLVDVKPNYTQRTEPATILDAVRSLG